MRRSYRSSKLRFNAIYRDAISPQGSKEFEPDADAMSPAAEFAPYFFTRAGFPGMVLMLLIKYFRLRRTIRFAQDIHAECQDIFPLPIGRPARHMPSAESRSASSRCSLLIDAVVMHITELCVYTWLRCFSGCLPGRSVEIVGHASYLHRRARPPARSVAL